MQIVPNYLLVVSQNLGLFPLKYVKNPEGEESLKFSISLFIRGITFVSFLFASSLYALYVDMEAYFTGQPAIRIKINVMGVLVDILPLITDLVVMFSSTVKKHQQFTKTCDILQTIDKDLHLRVQHSSFKWRMPATYAYVTILAIYGNLEPRFILYVPVQCISIMQASWLLQFTFTVETLTARFQMINKMIEKEIRKEMLEDLQKTKRFNNSSVGLSPSYPLKILIDSYSQLCAAADNAKDFYSGQILGKVSYAFTHIVLSLYFFFLNFQKTTETIPWVPNCILGVWCITHILQLLLLVAPCASLTDTVENTAIMISRLMNEDEKGNYKGVLNQLEMFLVQLLHYDLLFSASGLFTIHRHIITSIVGAVATYLVVLLQMNT